MVTMFRCQQSMCFAGFDLCPQHFLSVGELLSDCTSPQQCSVNDESTSPNMQSTHTHILLFGSKFYILGVYVHMLDIYQKYKKKSDFFLIFSKISQYFSTLPNLQLGCSWRQS